MVTQLGPSRLTHFEKKIGPVAINPEEEEEETNTQLAHSLFPLLIRQRRRREKRKIRRSTFSFTGEGDLSERVFSLS